MKPINQNVRRRPYFTPLTIERWKLRLIPITLVVVYLLAAWADEGFK